MMKHKPGILLLLSSAIRSGCGSSSAPPRPIQTGGVTELPVLGHPATPEKSASIEEAVVTAPSAMRLDRITSALFLFFSINKAMPAALTDLQSTDSTLIVVAPNNQPYEYYPQGLPLPNSADHKLLVVADPVKNQNGRRWCILASELKPGAPLTAEVMEIPEVTYSAYRFAKP